METVPLCYCELCCINIAPFLFLLFHSIFVLALLLHKDLNVLVGSRC